MELDYVEMFFLKDDQNELNIVTEDPIETYKLFWTYERDRYTKNKHFLLESNQKNLKFNFNYSSEKLTNFIIEWPNQAPILFSYRILPIPGMYNFRDIGGYRTVDGRHIKWGVGYRSDFLKNLKSEGIPIFKSLRLKSIIDYRSLKEIEVDPDPVIDKNIKQFDFDSEAELAADAGQLQSMKTNTSLKEKAKQALEQGRSGIQNMIDQQLSFVSTPVSNTAFANELRVLADPTNLPNMQHCRGGKDRTGFGVMLLEGILGLPKTTLIYDYMLTNRARSEKNQRYYHYFLRETDYDQELAGYLYSLFDTREEFIEASINQILSQYGKFDKYAIEVLKLEETDLDKLRSLFLEH